MTANQKTTLFATLTAVAVGVFSIGNAAAQNAKGAMLAKQANRITVTQQDTVVRVEKLHPSANRSYKVAGKRYQPLTKVSSFSQSGNASWYGSQFHGRKTASGERYNMHALTAAHRTLPIPSYAKVTNTRNGKSVIVRVNDRGPFHGNRVMDLSKAAAQKLGFINQGTAHVKIEQIVPGVKNQAAAKEIYVDLKTFSDKNEAVAFMEKTARNLSSAYDESKVSLEERGGEYVVRMGPFNGKDSAESAKAVAQMAI